MTRLSAIRAKLLDGVAIPALVNARVFTSRLPDDVTFPCIVLHELVADHLLTLTGGAAMCDCLVQIGCLTKGSGAELAVQELAEAVRQQISTFTGDLSSGVRGHVSGYRERAMPPEVQADRKFVHRIDCDVDIQIEESNPS